MNQVLLILLDAMRHDYIDEYNTPNLWRYAHEGEYYKKVRPNFGFCERTEILTGMLPAESGNFTAIGYDPSNSPYAKQPLLSFYRCINNELNLHGLTKMGKPIDLVYKVFRRFTNRILRSYNDSGLKTYNIPLNYLPFYSLTEDLHDHRAKNAFLRPSILDMMTDAKMKYFYSSFSALNLTSTGTDKDRLNLVLKNFSDDVSLYLVYLSLPDSLGHKFGPESKIFRDELRTFDKLVGSFVTEVKLRSRSPQFIFLGDHGMSTIKDTFDAEDEVRRICMQMRLQIHKDVHLFLDSTLVRIWARTKRIKRMVYDKILSDNIFSENGRLITREIAEEHNIPWGDRRYGDIMWWVNEGILIHPDYFHSRGSEKYKGMHGYDPNSNDSKGTCIIYGESISHSIHEEIELSSVFDLLKRLLKI
jgi:predicted AlkP superfamily pyrophosphatase or phosphodiesterase